MTDKRAVIRQPSGQPYWWVGVSLEGTQPSSLPSARQDCVIVGSGIAGLSCALKLVETNRSVCVLDSGSLGGGASTRTFASAGNGAALKFAGDRLALGEQRARERLAEDQRNYQDWLEFVRSEPQACDLSETGFITAAVTKDHLGRFRAAASIAAEEQIPSTIIEGASFRDWIGSDSYCGGIYMPDGSSFHPGKLISHMIKTAMRMGVSLYANHAVTRIERNGSGYRVSGHGFSIETDQVVVAINGYLGTLRGKFARYLDRRLIPVESNMIATAELPPEVINSVFPRPIFFADSRLSLYCVRTSPDNKRIMFSSRHGKKMSTAERATALLRDLKGVFPQLGSVEVEFSWPGVFAVSRDQRPHVGISDGIGFVSGCSGSGMVRHFALGRRLAERLIDPSAGTSTYGNDFPTFPALLPKWALTGAMTIYHDVLDYKK